MGWTTKICLRYNLARWYDHHENAQRYLSDDDISTFETCCDAWSYNDETSSVGVAFDLKLFSHLDVKVFLQSIAQENTMVSYAKLAIKAIELEQLRWPPRPKFHVAVLQALSRKSWLPPPNDTPQEVSKGDLKMGTWNMID